jgi:hypothetical protein
MDSTPAAWLPHSPLLSPAWRWGRARWLCERGQRPQPRLDDDGVRRARQFLLAAGSGEGGSVSARAPRADPALAQAYQLFRGEPPHTRWRLEAYLLTAEPLAAVARRCALPLATVHTYHDTFFAVRPRLDARDWVMTQAVRAGAWDGFARDYPGCVWKGFAYAAGPLALELAVAVTTDGPLPGWARASCPGRAAYREARLRLACQLILAALTAQSGAELGPVVEARERLRRLDRQAAQARDEPAGLLPVREEFLASVVTGRRKPGGKTGAERPKSMKRASDVGTAKKARRHLPIASLLAGLW